ncbi:MAG: hypothetical protein NZ699_11910 [Roseiflexus sp.]|nr:hypothetical protein [Roseiflexus sp.]MDW8146102.1 hypothetical protein [Roseiflexaceae bacterium]
MGWAFNAARDLWEGRDPYRHQPSIMLVPYPLTAAVIVFPWAFFPSMWGVVLLFGITSACLAYALTRDNQYWRLIIFVSPAYFMALKSIQWSPFFMLALFLPAFAPVLLAKPTLALPVALSITWTPLRLLLTVLTGIIPFIVMPDWFWRWIAQVRSYDGFIPLLSWFGPIFLISGLFWRDVRARLFFLMTLVPQHRFFYDQLLLWAIPQTRQQMLILTISSWIGFYYIWLSFDTLWVHEAYLLATTYLPAFLMTLWQQPALHQRFRAMFKRLPGKHNQINVR